MCHLSCEETFWISTVRRTRVWIWITNIEPKRLRWEQSIKPLSNTTRFGDPSTPAGKKLSPVGHETAALLEHVTSAVGGLDCVANGVRQGHLGQLVRIVRLLRRPVLEGRAPPDDLAWLSFWPKEWSRLKIPDRFRTRSQGETHRCGMQPGWSVPDTARPRRRSTECG